MAKIRIDGYSDDSKKLLIISNERWQFMKELIQEGAKAKGYQEEVEYNLEEYN
jgi:hypothetical protein